MSEKTKAEKIVAAAFLGARMGAPVGIRFQDVVAEGGRKNTLITVSCQSQSPNAEHIMPTTIHKMVDAARMAIVNETALALDVVGRATDMELHLNFNGTLPDLEKAEPADVMKGAERLLAASMGRGGNGGVGGR